MKSILVTGVNSYLSKNLKRYLESFSNLYKVELLSLRGQEWESKDFSGYDTVVHVAGLAHQKEKLDNKEMYYIVNRDLAYNFACRVKKDGVQHFIFISSMSVFGLETGCVNQSTIESPTTYYGDSKLQAEKLISQLEDNSFKLAIIRPPMIYGEKCTGNYNKLSLFAQKTPVFPKVNNKRSMIYIENLCEFIRLLIENGDKGKFHPQNKEYVCTSNMVSEIANVRKKRILFIGGLNPFIKKLRVRTLLKIFGDLTYDKSISEYKADYSLISFESSIKLTEEGD